MATASAQLSSKPATPGDKVTLLGLSSRLEQGSSAEVVSRQTAVKDVAWQKLNMPTPPRYQQQNLELVRVMDTIRSDGGVLVDDSSGAVVALWSSFFYQRGGSRPAESQFVAGMPVECIATAAEQLRVALRTKADIPPLQALGLDFETISLAQARKRGLDDATTSVLRISK